MSSPFAHIPTHQVDQKHARVSEVLDQMIAARREHLGGLSPTEAWLSGGEAVIYTACAVEGPEMADALIVSLLSMAIGRLADGKSR